VQLQAFNRFTPVVRVAAGQASQSSTSSERIIMVGPTPPSAYLPTVYPIAPTAASTRVDLLQSWLNGQLSDANDSVFVTKEGNDQYKIDVNGEIEYVSGEELKKLKFDLKGGKDSLVIGEGVPIDITAELGDGDDQFWGGAGNDNVNGGNGNDKIYGRGGDDSMSGGAGEDEIWGLQGHNTMAGGSGRDVFVTSSVSQALMDFTTGEDSLPNAAAAPNNAVTAAPTNTPVNAAPAATVPSNSAPATPSPVLATAAVSTTPGNATLATLMASPKGTGYTQTSPGVWTAQGDGTTTTMTQPGGAGAPIYNTLTSTSGVSKGGVTVTEIKPDGSTKFVSYNNPNLTAVQNKAMNDLLDKGLLDGLDNAFTSVKKKKGGGSATTGAGAAAGGPGEGMSGSIDGASGLDGTSGLDTNVSDGSDSWFMVLAVAMGTIMNKMAEKMIGLLNKIKAAGDDPPYALTAEFQATAQMLSFMQQAFMTALNSLGESIKTSVTAGGAAR
jgi:hypothetical protein